MEQFDNYGTLTGKKIYSEQGDYYMISLQHHAPKLQRAGAIGILHYYLEKATSQSQLNDFLNKRLETISVDGKLPFLEQIKVQSELDQRKNRGLTATQTQWFDEYLQSFKATQQPTAQHDEQPAATVPAVPDEQPTKASDEQPTLDTNKLKQLFKPVFFADDYKQRETHNDTIKLSRFDIFVEQLKNLLSDAKCKKLTVGNVAYMIHKSKFAKDQFKRRGKFAETCRLLFECCKRETPKDMKPNKYKQPDNETMQRFSDVLGNPINPQK